MIICQSFWCFLNWYFWYTIFKEHRFMDYILWLPNCGHPMIWSHNPLDSPRQVWANTRSLRLGDPWFLYPAWCWSSDLVTLGCFGGQVRVDATWEMETGRSWRILGMSRWRFPIGRISTPQWSFTGTKMVSGWPSIVTCLAFIRIVDVVIVIIVDVVFVITTVTPKSAQKGGGKWKRTCLFHE